MDQANAQKDNGERKGSEGMTKEERRTVYPKFTKALNEAEDLDQHNRYIEAFINKYGYKEYIIWTLTDGHEDRRRYWTAFFQEQFGRGTAIKDLDPAEREKAIYRLNAIPSEFEVMKYLRYKGKILFDPDRYFTGGMNYYEGVDICFMDQEEPDKGLTNLAGVDVKNTGNYNNFLIETEKKQANTGWQWSTKYAWAKHILTGTNRYVAYVRGGQEYGGELASETEAFSLDKSERENARDLIQYYYNRQYLLDHTIEIIRGEDIKSYLEQHGRAPAIKNYLRGYKILINEEWIEQYNFPALRITRDRDGWTETQLNANNPLTIQTKKCKTTHDISAMINNIRDRQADGVNDGILRTLFGLPDKIWTDQEITDQVKIQINEDIGKGEDQSDHEKLIQYYIDQGIITREDLDY